MGGKEPYHLTNSPEKAPLKDGGGTRKDKRLLHPSVFSESGPLLFPRRSRPGRGGNLRAVPPAFERVGKTGILLRPGIFLTSLGCGPGLILPVSRLLRIDLRSSDVRGASILGPGTAGNGSFPVIERRKISALVPSRFHRGEIFVGELSVVGAVSGRYDIRVVLKAELFLAL